MKKASLLARLGIAAVLTLGLEGIATKANSTEIFVRDVPHGIYTIQQGINVATSGDTVTVRDGYYGESINPLYQEHFPLQVNKPIVIRSEHGSGSTRLLNWNNGQGMPTLVVQITSDATVQGFEIDGAYNPLTDSEGAQIGVDIGNSSSPVITNCYVHSNETEQIRNRYAGNPQIFASEIELASVYNRAITSIDRSSPFIRGNSFTLGPGALAGSFITDAPIITYLASGPTASLSAIENSFEEPPPTFTGSVTSFVAYQNATEQNAVFNDNIYPSSIQAEIDAVRQLPIEQRILYNFEFIDDWHDNHDWGFVDVLGDHVTSVPTVSPRSEPSTWGKIKSEYKHLH